MKKDKYFYMQLFFTLTVCAFLIVPVFMSVVAGLTNNYFVGVKSGFTFRWVEQVWALYSDTIWLTLQIAIATTLINVVIGVPCAYVLAKSKSRWASIFDELLTLPIAIPGMAISLGLILAYGGFNDFRSSWMFILVGHVIFTLPFMVKSVLSILQSINFRVLEEGAASLGATFWQRFFDVIVPNCKAGIVAGMLMTLTLSIGEFNLTWMLHTPLTKTLPVGLADSYASMRLEISSAYTLIFLCLILPLLVLAQALNKKPVTNN
ncbi:ABC transporter permease [Vibrio cyclitrophicus]|uniref:ABC transporter permease n=3 Tax=Vibrio cyclitrophicus TaxID=47951 RepID=A0A7Z1MM83_9VIBR|nr:MULTISPECIES: ABC transporter permease subunit [Vibrio]MBY7662305.1 ABC transporter permease subunit [Vibrio atlanticus]MBE8604616.1 ABC transporter permease subunit [Vibrio sp. OPT10]MBU2932799.1 ABC transporter permease subunit [Vibrio cyclitrophicus]MCC4774589.1 ABC transporter permease subunit [Vibrio cyclitrophicus]MCC4844314.1 ABC transporter permease subunit [Vibrio cyclitrophicus]